MHSFTRMAGALTLAGALAAGQAAAGTPDDLTGRVFISNEWDATLTILDGDTHEEIKVLEVGERPRDMGFSPDGSELYVALGIPDQIAVVDPVEMEVIRKISGGIDPEAMSVHPESGHIYISNEVTEEVLEIDPSGDGEILDRLKTGIEPEGNVVTPDGNYILNVSESSHMLHVFTWPDHDRIENILVGTRPRELATTRDSKIAYVTSEVAGEIVKVDLEEFRIVGEGRFRGVRNPRPKDVRLNRDETELYVAMGRSDRIAVLDAQTLEVLDQIPVGERVWGLGVNRDRTILYTTDGDSNQVSIIDMEENEVIKQLQVGDSPWGVIRHDWHVDDEMAPR